LALSENFLSQLLAEVFFAEVCRLLPSVSIEHSVDIRVEPLNLFFAEKPVFLDPHAGALDHAYTRVRSAFALISKAFTPTLSPVLSVPLQKHGLRDSVLMVLKHVFVEGFDLAGHRPLFLRG